MGRPRTLTDVLDIRPARPDDPDALFLTDEVQRYYVELYGLADEDPVDPDAFVPPRGRFLLGYDEASPVAMAGWTWRRDLATDAQVRRLYVRPAGRRSGHAAALLGALEADARAAGATRMVLETGDPQRDAVQFYRARGYRDVESFGFHADSPFSVHLGTTL